MNTDSKKLLDMANAARERAYSPYSGITVGAALLTKEGNIYTGANIENSSYGATVCAERVALFDAVMRGERNFAAIAVAGGEKDRAQKDGFFPCGICLQALSEFADKDFIIITSSGGGVEESRLGSLMPRAFGKELL